MCSGNGFSLVTFAFLKIEKTGPCTSQWKKNMLNFLHIHTLKAGFMLETVTCEDASFQNALTHAFQKLPTLRLFNRKREAYGDTTLSLCTGKKKV